MKKASFTALLLLLLMNAWSSEVRWGALEELKSLLPASRPAGNLTPEEAFQAALVLEGVPGEARAAYREKLALVLEAAGAELLPADAPEKKADTLLQLLHTDLLKKYASGQTRLSVLLDTGTYNCVSSALLYGILAAQLGLDVNFVGTRDHAFCVVNLPDRKVDVETTTPLGFDPGRKREFQDAFGKVTGFAYVPPGQYGRRTPLNFRGILGLLLQNLVAEDQQKGEALAPLGLAFDRHYLEDTAESREFLFQVFKNLAAYRNDRKEYRLSLEEALKMQELAGSHPVLTDIRKSMVNNHLVDEVKKQNWASAREFLKNHGNDLGPQVTQWQTSIAQGESKDIFLSGGLPAVLLWLRSRGPEDLPPDTRVSLEENYFLQTLTPLMNRQKWTESLDLFNTLTPELLARPKIAEAAKNLRYNQTVEVHNQFAALMNKGDRAGAQSLLEEALKTFPESRILQDDLRLLQNLQKTR